MGVEGSAWYEYCDDTRPDLPLSHTVSCVSGIIITDKRHMLCLILICGLNGVDAMP